MKLKRLDTLCGLYQTRNLRCRQDKVHTCTFRNTVAAVGTVVWWTVIEGHVSLPSTTEFALRKSPNLWLPLDICAAVHLLHAFDGQVNLLPALCKDARRPHHKAGMIAEGRCSLSASCSAPGPGLCSAFHLFYSAHNMQVMGIKVAE